MDTYIHIHIHILIKSCYFILKIQQQPPQLTKMGLQPGLLGQPIPMIGTHPIITGKSTASTNPRTENGDIWIIFKTWFGIVKRSWKLGHFSLYFSARHPVMLCFVSNLISFGESQWNIQTARLILSLYYSELWIVQMYNCLNIISQSLSDNSCDKHLYAFYEK